MKQNTVNTMQALNARAEKEYQARLAAEIKRDRELRNEELISEGKEPILTRDEQFTRDQMEIEEMESRLGIDVDPNYVPEKQYFTFSSHAFSPKGASGGFFDNDTRVITPPSGAAIPLNDRQ